MRGHRDGLKFCPNLIPIPASWLDERLTPCTQSNSYLTQIYPPCIDRLAQPTQTQLQPRGIPRCVAWSRPSSVLFHSKNHFQVYIRAAEIGHGGSRRPNQGVSPTSLHDVANTALVVTHYVVQEKVRRGAESGTARLGGNGACSRPCVAHLRATYALAFVW